MKNILILKKSEIQAPKPNQPNLKFILQKTHQENEEQNPGLNFGKVVLRITTQINQIIIVHNDQKIPLKTPWMKRYTGSNVRY